MLCDLVSFVLSAGTGGGSAVGDLIFDGAIGRQLSASHVFAGSAGKIVCLSDVEEIAFCFTPEPVVGLYFVGRPDE